MNTDTISDAKWEAMLAVERRCQRQRGCSPSACSALESLAERRRSASWRKHVKPTPSARVKHHQGADQQPPAGGGAQSEGHVMSDLTYDKGEVAGRDQGNVAVRPWLLLGRCNARLAGPIWLAETWTTTY